MKLRELGVSVKKKSITLNIFEKSPFVKKNVSKDMIVKVVLLLFLTSITFL